MWIFILPFVAIAVVVMLLVASRYARRDAGSGPHPDDVPGAPE